MSKKSLLILLMAFNSWMPWTHEAKALLQDRNAMIIFSGQPGYARGECCLIEPPGFMINSNCEMEDIGMVSLHEAQHLLGHVYVTPSGTPLYEDWFRTESWDSFSRLAIVCAKDTAPENMRLVRKFADLGPWELHAQLPWLLQGKLCPKLQPWYPWFDLSWVATPQEDASRPVLKGHVKGIRQYIAPA